MATTSRTTEPYELHPRTEAALATMCSSRPSFFSRIGARVDPEAVVSIPARWALKAAQEISRETGNSPGSTVIVLERLQRWYRAGNVLYEEVKEVEAMFDACEDIGLPPEESLLAEVVPAVKRRMQNIGLLKGMSGFANKASMKPAIDILTEADQLGAAPVVSGGVNLQDPKLAEVYERESVVPRLGLGIPELDEAIGVSVLDSGLPRRALGLVAAGTGVGKSVFLSHVASAGVRKHRFVLVATLELSEKAVTHRIVASVIGAPIDHVAANFAEAQKKYLDVVKVGGGDCRVKFFDPHITTVKQIREWVGFEGARASRRPDVVVVDYADKLSSGAKGPEEKVESQYTAQRAVYQELRGLAMQEDLWVWTASQTRRASEKRSKNYKLGPEDVSDSLHKSREADLIITLNPGEDTGDGRKSMFFNIAKNRNGVTGTIVGPLPADFALGRIGPVNW